MTSLQVRENAYFWGGKMRVIANINRVEIEVKSLRPMAWQPDVGSQNAFKEAGMLKVEQRIVAILVLGGVLMMNPFHVWGDEPSGTIHGIVFVDEDDDGEYDPGEPVLEGVTIGLTNGEIILETKTDGTGAFVFNVGPGVWQGVIYPPQGYSVINDATREVVIEPEGTLEAVLDFGLIQEFEADQGGAEPVDFPEEVEEESVVSSPEDMAQTDYYEGEAPALDVVQVDNADQGEAYTGVLGMILPESGFPIPLKWVLGILVVVILIGGASLIFIGRRLQR
jgi:hypothetical protein